MIIREYYMTRSDGIKLYRTYSDEEKPIRQIQTGIIYSEAIDLEHAPYTYEEVDSFEESAEYREIPEKVLEPFAKGERGWWKEELYESLFDEQMWNPEQFAAGWVKIPTE